MRDLALVVVGALIITILLEGTPQLGGAFLLLLVFAMLASAKNLPKL